MELCAQEVDGDVASGVELKVLLEAEGGSHVPVSDKKRKRGRAGSPLSTPGQDGGTHTEEDPLVNVLYAVKHEVNASKFDSAWPPLKCSSKAAFLNLWPSSLAFVSRVPVTVPDLC